MNDARYAQWFPAVRELIWNELSHFVSEIEKSEHIPHEHVIPKLASLGLYGCLVPESYGGLGLTIKQYIPVLIELSKMYAGLRVICTLTFLPASCWRLAPKSKSNDFILVSLPARYSSVSH